MDESQGPGHGASDITGLAVYFPAYAGTKLYCLVTEARVRKQLAQGRYPESNPQPQAL